jgi:type IV pilus assembly protein PilA
LKKAAGFTLIELLIVVAIIGIIAAIAIPSLLRARISANEAATIGDIRTVISAQAAYHSANSAFYGAISCLGTGASTCIAGYNGPTFLDPGMASLAPKAGYQRSFLMEPAPTGPPGAAHVYCYQASPSSSQTGVRSFAGDSSGIIGSTNFAANCCLATGVRDASLCVPIR